MSRPNIVLIDAHDAGTWFGCYDRPYLESPNIDRLAAEGVRFDNNIAVCPICGPSRLAFATGILPHALDVYGNAPYEPRAACAPLPRALGDAGYRTMMYGSWKTNGDRAWAGYEESFPEVPLPPAAAVRGGEAGTRERPSGAGYDAGLSSFRHALDNGTPLFAHFSFHRCHRPFGQQYDEEVACSVEVPSSLPDTPTVRRDLASLCRTVSELDAQVGVVLNTIDEAGHADDSVVVFLTDHGPAIGRHKHTLYEGGIRTALIIRHPDGRGSATARPPVGNLDLYPTLLEIAGLDPPPGPAAGREDEAAAYAATATSLAALHARSFLPLILGKTYARRAATVSCFTYGQRSGMQYYTPMRCLRTDLYKLIHNYTDLPRYLDTDWLGRFTLERETVEDWPLFGRAVPTLELYDLVEDPWETRNIADDPRHRTRAHQMDGALESILEATGDEILSGAVESKKISPVVQQWVRPEHSADYVLHYDYSSETKERPFGWEETR